MHPDNLVARGKSNLPNILVIVARLRLLVDFGSWRTVLQTGLGI